MTWDTDSVAAAEVDDTLTQAWRRKPGFLAGLALVNHKVIGMRFIVTGFVFFLVGGVLALLIRTQLAVPENSFLAADVYNQFFTMHGTTMMFLFAVPILEGLGIYLLPLMLGTRDAPFPRLNSFGYWLYLFGGLFAFSSFLAGQIPDKGWFAYVPLSTGLFSPDMGMDFWLLGITMVEISGILGALELIVVFLRRRAPGMTLSRIPLFGWAIVVMSAMMVVAFPVLVAASTLLELERTTGLVFFDAALGGAPLLWQHLFWFFGHPEVYIMLLPAAGMISMIVPVFSRRVIAAYGWVVGALVAIGVASFGLWVHHMFTVGLPSVAMAFFTAASVLIAIPSGVLVFSWLATMWHGRATFKPPLLFVIGFLVVFVIGGITGVMVASVPFDTQAHDSFFLVAHFHYVLLGGVVFPVFAALYYWFPKFTGRMTSDRLGAWAFWVMFVGVNLTFFPQHFLGLQGMPRRVFTYDAGLGWELGNMLSTLGAFLLAAGVGVAIKDFWSARRSGPPAGPDPWAGNSLEWATESPPPPYNFRRLPVVAAADPLWDDASVREPDWVEALAAPPEPVREVVDTSPVEADPEEIVVLPGPSLWPLWTALALVVALAGVLVSQPIIALAGVVALVTTLIGWGASGPGDVVERELIGEQRRSPIGIWGLWIGIVSMAVVFGSFVVSHLYLMLVVDERAAVVEADGMPLAVATVVAVAAGVAAWAAGRRDRAAGPGQLALHVLLALIVAGAGVWVLVGLDGAAGSAQISSLVVVTGFGVFVAVALAGGLVAAALHVARATTAARTAVQAARLFAMALAWTWVLIAVVLVVSPRL